MNNDQLHGYLFERFCRMLFEDAGFNVLNNDGIKVRYRGRSNNIIDMCGRGTWHQIDLPYEFQYPVPFVNPIRVIGEVKHFKSEISKAYIRSFIGVVKDISENYITSNVMHHNDLVQRTLDQAVYVSKSAFQLEAQKLANAHNVKLITIDSNPIFQRLFESFGRLRFPFYNGSMYHTNGKVSDENFNRDQLEYIDDVFHTNLRSYFLGTTNTGHLLYFVSDKSFDIDEYSNNGTVNAYITYPEVNNRLTGNIQLHIGQSIFHSTLPKLVLDEFQTEHNERGNAIQSKYHHFSPLTVYKKNVNGQLKVYSIYFNHEMR